MMLGKLQRAHPTLRGHFARAYFVGSNMLRAYLFFIYAKITQIFVPTQHIVRTQVEFCNYTEINFYTLCPSRVL